MPCQLATVRRSGLLNIAIECEPALRGEYSIVIASSFPVSRHRGLDTRTEINLWHRQPSDIDAINHVRYRTVTLPQSLAVALVSYFCHQTTRTTSAKKSVATNFAIARIFLVFLFFAPKRLSAGRRTPVSAFESKLPRGLGRRRCRSYQTCSFC